MTDQYKNAIAFRVSEEQMADAYGFHQLGHSEPVAPSPQQIAEHARAIELVAEIESNPYLRLGGYDYELDVEPLQTERWVADETHEEWMSRWRSHVAANPGAKALRNPLQDMLAGAFARALDAHTEGLPDD